ncbi:MAG: methyltransferase domain-containing protein [Rubrivivax sp.]|nr:methyltransferase domain-containing protein [Rubrivivax sp.]
MTSHRSEIDSAQRFAFGANWAAFLERLDDTRIAEAERSLATMLGIADLRGRRFLDVGSGSGLFSLAARRLGAEVHSFDYDPDSVACTRLLRDKLGASDSDWKVAEGSVLDRPFMDALGHYDIVYSWGVLHHTGAMWEALANTVARVAVGGQLFIAIYNDQGRASRLWLRTKKAYNRLPSALRWLVLWPSALRLWGPTTLRDLARGQPGATWRAVKQDRGMDPWRDVVDWVGGLPFEVAKPEQIFEFVQRQGFTLEKLTTCAGGHGCNQYVFHRTGPESDAA